MVSFGLTNMPSIFMRLMNGVFCTYLDHFFLVLLDDILIYSRYMEEHEGHLQRVLQCLKENQLYANLAKCDFFQSEVNYLAHLVSREGVSVDPSKIQTIVDWPAPTNVSEVWSFMGLAGYYRHFVQSFSWIGNPITSLQRKGKNFLFG